MYFFSGGGYGGWWETDGLTNGCSSVGISKTQPVEILEQNNALSMFGLQRRLRGAAVGHLAAFEATSSLPSRRNASSRSGVARRRADRIDSH